LTTDEKHGKILPTRNGFAVCPCCGHKLIRLTPQTSAEQLPIYCRKCREYLTVNIDRGQCFFSPCPISLTGD
jgi:hypothetical protein